MAYHFTAKQMREKSQQFSIKLITDIEKDMIKATEKGEYECNISIQNYCANSKISKEEKQIHYNNIKNYFKERGFQIFQSSDPLCDFAITWEF